VLALRGQQFAGFSDKNVIAMRLGMSLSASFGGRGGIRTHGTLAGTPVFKTGALNHSATLPSLELKHLARPLRRGKGPLPPIAAAMGPICFHSARAARKAASMIARCP
jgi:hypothetical protein